MSETELNPCPYPCGWDELNILIFKNLAWFSKRTADDDVPDDVRDAGINLGLVARRLCEFSRDNQPRPAVQGEPVALPPFTTKIIEKLRRFDVCAEDGQDVDIGRHWLDMLVQLGLLNRVQRSPALWEMAQQGEDVLEGYAAPQPYPDVSALVEALELALEYWRHRQQRYKNRRPKWVIAAESALAAHRKRGGDV